jgi:superfamily I DNA and/or RNA helicase
LILVGDRKQLPPNLSTTSLHNNGLEKTLFERLILNGLPTMTLRTQYRVSITTIDCLKCHPDISSLSNDLFYNGILKNGISAQERPCMIPELPVVTFIPVDGTEKMTHSLSYSNVKESQAIFSLVQHLLKQGVSSQDMGIICLCKMKKN